MSFYSKQAESEALQNEVDKFLASGGEIKKLDTGFTNFKDGLIPKSKERRICEKRQAEKEQEIKQKNMLIQQQKEQKKAQAMLEAKANQDVIEKQKQLRRKNIISEQVAMLSDFRKKAVRGDLARLVKEAGVSSKTLLNASRGHAKIGDKRLEKIKEVMRNFEFGKRLSEDEIKDQLKKRAREAYRKKKPPSGESLRRMEVVARREEAEKRGEKVFTAPCAVHGMTSYRIYNNASRCLECRLKMSKKYLEPKLDGVQKDRKERTDYNRSMMQQAMAKQEVTFQGLCRKCGYTQFRIFKQTGKTESHGYRCIACTIETSRRYNQKRVKK